jgi:hypothetical protein
MHLKFEKYGTGRVFGNANERMNQWQKEKAPLAATVGKKNPDVIVLHTDHTALFKMQNRRASEWLRQHYHSTTGDVKGDTEIRVHPGRCKNIVAELKAAGFIVANRKEELC